MKRIYLVLLISIYFRILSAYASEPLPQFLIYEDSLRVLAAQIVEPENDFERLANNLVFKEYFREVLEKDNSFFYPFDSLLTVSFLKAPDESFRIITWYVPLSESQFEYFGFVQSYIKRKKDYKLFELEDSSANMEEPETQTLKHENWYGAYYTRLIHNRHKRRDYYSLLAWRGDNPLTRKRIIEPIRIMGNGRPSFGQSVFKYKNNKMRRIIFEYSSQVSMSIKYERHSIPGKRRPVDIIIFDRLAPLHSFMKGNYQFYKPESNIFDGFYFDDGKWIFIEDIDARMPERRPPPRPTPPR